MYLLREQRDSSARAIVKELIGATPHEGDYYAGQIRRPSHRANQGIGLQIAKDLAAYGFTVLVGSRNLERSEAAAREVGSDARFTN